MKWRPLALLLLAATVILAKKKGHHRHRVPEIDLNGADVLVGTIREDELTLALVPQLGIISESGPVCSYELSSPSGDLIPFNVEVLDHYTGAAVIRIKESATLDCKKSEYDLNVIAIKCDEDARSEPVKLKVTVKDTNNHEPRWEHPWYTAHVSEGKENVEIIRISAVDDDCGHPYGEICEYEISNGLEGAPFSIDKQGMIRNTQPLKYSNAHSYILTVAAHDCGQRKSKALLVTIKVDQACVEGIKGVEERIAYEAGSANTPASIFSNIELKTCPDTECTVSSATAEVELHSSHVDETCGREDLPVYSNESIKSCGLSPAASKLMDGVKEFAGASDEQEIKKEKSGALAHIVPVDAFDGLVADHFALSFSMKHAKGSKDEQKGKQHVLCESDETGMNRHHFSVYIRHCKLEVVLRREAGSPEEFAAAEWRWNIPEVCDNSWHSYSLLFDGIDNVELVIDGRPLKHEERNPEILDDWPLHRTGDLKTRLTVGACWHGRSLALAQFFKGSLANVALLNGATEKASAIGCAHACPERLQLKGAETSETTSTTLKLQAPTVEELQAKMRQVTYVNTKSEPLPGHRGIRASVSVECSKQAKTITLPEYKGYIFVKKEVDPVISISGQTLLTVDQKALRIGTPMIPELKIVVSRTDEEGKTKDVTAETKLDYCKVHLKPSRDADLEYFSSPATLIASTKIDFEHDKQGMSLHGADWTASYQEVLQRIHYFNTRPDAYSKRIYAVQCGAHDGRIVSNELVITMSIDIITATKSSPTSPPIKMINLEAMESEEHNRHFEPDFDQLGGGARLQNILEMELPRPKALLSHHNYEMGQGAVAGGAVAVVVVVCVGFLLVLLVVGVLKMRDTPLPSSSRRHRRNRRSQDGMEWDDAGMNITVNPLEDVEKAVGGGVSSSVGVVRDEEFSDEDSSDGDESECSYREEDDEEMSEDDDEEETEILPVNHQAPPLEWDDEATSSSPLTNSTSSNRPPSSRSYRV